MPFDGQWVYPASRWVMRYRCDSDDQNGQLIIQFHSGFCCTYPGTDVNTFDIMLGWPMKGQFVDRFFKKPHWPYVAIAPPPGP